MKRKLISIILAAAMVCSLAACGNESNEASQESSKKPDIIMWAPVLTSSDQQMIDDGIKRSDRALDCLWVFPMVSLLHLSDWLAAAHI